MDYFHIETQMMRTMLQFTVFPNLRLESNQYANPYIQDFIRALDESGEATVVNPPHKNPLLSLLPVKRWGDIVVFNWFESIPDFKYGFLQAWIAFFFLIILKLCGRKVVWIYHNRKPHADGQAFMKQLLARHIARLSNLIVTHAQEGVDLIKERYPFAAGKVYFLHHPTKDRTGLRHFGIASEYDVLIWGHIARYKGVFDFIRLLREKQVTDLRVCVAGGCTDDTFNELKQLAPPQVTLIHRSLSFEELASYIDKSDFVLAPYFPETVLSSGMLMDSLSYGAKIIGPAIGSFNDYANLPELKVYTFSSFQDILQIVRLHRNEQPDINAYRTFLKNNDWHHFIQSFLTLIKKH